MANTITIKQTHQHFAASSGDTVTFSRPINHLTLTTTVATLTISFDGGTNYMALAAGTIQLLHVNAASIVFSGTGSCTGMGVAL